MDMHRRAGSRRDTDGRLCHRRQSEQRACAAGSHHTCHDNRTGGNGSIRCDVCITAVISRTADHAGDNTEDNTGNNTADDKGGSRFSGTVDTVKELEPDATVTEGLSIRGGEVADSEADVRDSI